ncbi:hypothetical protein [Saccharopolyspora sp. ASAGF58]|uniref:hypothetical protein n=1 Tax=Saccharopolyspora sp. ASAGF58 TaxID=2719023 RepID=UPI001FF0B5E6|nr:hypothetical protein [Saccharopolyspora sp. ASAGF58]
MQPVGTGAGDWLRPRAVPATTGRGYEGRHPGLFPQCQDSEDLKECIVDRHERFIVCGGRPAAAIVNVVGRLGNRGDRAPTISSGHDTSTEPVERIDRQ